MFYSIPQTKMLSAAQNSLSVTARRKSLFLEVLIFLLVFMISTIPQEIVMSIITSFVMMTDPEYYELMNYAMSDTSISLETIMEYSLKLMSKIPPEAYIAVIASSGAMIPAAIIYCNKIEKRSLFSMGFNKRGVVSEYLIGILVGGAMISIPVVICILTGAVTLTFNPAVNPLIIVLFLLAFVLQGMGEEVLLRGYLLTTLSRRVNIWVAIIISSFMFSAMHMGNANFNIIAFVNITLFGIFAAVYMLKRGSIWGIGAIHTIWNFMQGNIYGFSVSGNPEFNTVFNCELGSVGSVLSGGSFGIEGGLGATIVLLLALLIVFVFPAKKSEIDENARMIM